jgi:hypothetical protein
MLIKHRKLQYQTPISNISIRILVISLNIADILQNTVNPSIDDDPDADEYPMHKWAVGAGVIPVI